MGVLSFLKYIYTEVGERGGASGEKVKLGYIGSKSKRVYPAVNNSGTNRSQYS
jgi:hypothetical protein